MNQDYSLCPTYPPAVIVPRSVDDDALRRLARFRQGGRFPVLCYYHQKNRMVRLLATLGGYLNSKLKKKENSRLPQVIMRSGQPLIGANKRRCKEDEDLLQAAIEGSDKGFIIDTRSSQQAQQARMAGGGFESKSSYSRWKRLHRQMERCARPRGP